MSKDIKAVRCKSGLNGVVSKYRLDPEKCCQAFEEVSNEHLGMKCTRKGSFARCHYSEEFIVSVYWTSFGFFLVEHQNHKFYHKLLALLTNFCCIIIEEISSEDMNNLDDLNFMFGSETFPPVVKSLHSKGDSLSDSSFIAVDSEEELESFYSEEDNAPLSDEDSEDFWV